METGQEENNEIKHERIRVKKRVRIKKKSDPKSKVKKWATGAVWLVVVGLFIYMLIVMVREADLKARDKNFFTPPAVENLLNQISL